MSVCHLIYSPSTCSVIHQLRVISQHFLRTEGCVSHSDQIPGPAGHSCWTCGVCTLQHFPKVNVSRALFSSIIRMSAARSFDSPRCVLSVPQNEDEAPLPHAIACTFLPTSLSTTRRQSEGEVLPHSPLIQSLLSFHLQKMSHLGFCQMCCAMCSSTQRMCLLACRVGYFTLCTNGCKPWVTNHVRT